MPSFKLFKKKEYVQKGGPKSFHKFTYQGINILLIGESHVKMPRDLANEYIKVFNNFIEKMGNVKLFLEGSGLKEQESETEGLTFIDSMESLDQTSMLQILHDDDRPDKDNFVNFFNFEDLVSEFEDKTVALFHKKGIKQPKNVPFIFDPDFLECMINIVNDELDNSFCLQDLYILINSHRDNLLNLEEKYAKENSPLDSYLNNCISELNIAIGLLGKFEKDYRLIHGLPISNYEELLESYLTLKSDNMNHNETKNKELLELSQTSMGTTQTSCDFQRQVMQKKLSIVLSEAKGLAAEELESKKDILEVPNNNIENPSIMEMCLDMMTHEKTYLPLHELFSIYDKYIIYYYDAVLMCDLWEQIKKSKENGSTLVVVSGDTHIINLSKFLKNFAEEDESILASKDGSVFSPQKIHELLGEHFELQPQTTCVLM